jgi:hypothetical protein
MYRLFYFLWFLLFIVGLPLDFVMEILLARFRGKREDNRAPDVQLSAMMDRSFLCGLVTLAIIAALTCYLLLK